MHISRPFLRLAYQYLLKKLEGFDNRELLTRMISLVLLSLLIFVRKQEYIHTYIQEKTQTQKYSERKMKTNPYNRLRLTTKQLLKSDKNKKRRLLKENSVRNESALPVYLLWFNFIHGLNFISLCFWVW